MNTFPRDTGRTQIGWDCFIDLACIYSQAGNWPTSYQVFDARGCRGPTKFLLAELGFTVTNLDLLLSESAPCILKKYRIKYVPADSYQETTYVDHMAKSSIKYHVLKKLRGVVNDSSLYQYVSSQKYRKLHDR